jgi:hypothetical protein
MKLKKEELPLVPFVAVIKDPCASTHVCMCKCIYLFHFPINWKFPQQITNHEIPSAIKRIT